jgi:hypothetical protein
MNVLIEYRMLYNSYQEWWRDVPDEARQPSIFIEMVPIHTKRMLWKMGERSLFTMPFCLCRKAFLIFPI